MNNHSDLDLQGFAARALLAIQEGRAKEAERATIRDSRQFIYHEDGNDDLLVVETRFGNEYNVSQRFVLYGDKRGKALWRLTIDTWCPERGTHDRLGLSPHVSLQFLNDIRAKAFRLGRVTDFKNAERKLRDNPVVMLLFNDNTMDSDFRRFLGDLSVKIRLYGPKGTPEESKYKEHELWEAYYQGGRF